MKNLFHLNILLLLIWLIMILLGPFYSFIGCIIHGFIQVGMSFIMIFNKTVDKEISLMGMIHLIVSFIACVLLFSIGIHLKTWLPVLGLLMAVILFFFSIFSTYRYMLISKEYDSAKPNPN
jgi:hypothetical protein